MDYIRAWAMLEVFEYVKSGVKSGLVEDLLYTRPPSSRTRRLHHHITRPLSDSSQSRTIKVRFEFEEVTDRAKSRICPDRKGIDDTYWFNATSRAVDPVIPSDNSSPLVGVWPVPLLTYAHQEAPWALNGAPDVKKAS